MSVSVAVVGATGAVGEMMRKVLDERNFPVRVDQVPRLRAQCRQNDRVSRQTLHRRADPPRGVRRRATSFCPARRPRSAGSSARSRPRPGPSSSITPRPGAWTRTCRSSCRRSTPTPCTNIPKGIVANPNCSTIQMVVALKPLHDLAKIKRVVVSTYQASSGKGAKGLLDFDAQLSAIGAGRAGARRRRPTRPSWPATSCRTTGSSTPNGYTEEEKKVDQRDARRSWATQRFGVSPTCVRVPVRIGHSEAINVEFAPADHGRAGARRRCAKAPGIVLMDETQGRGAAAAPRRGPRRDVRRPHAARIRRSRTA